MLEYVCKMFRIYKSVLAVLSKTKCESYEIPKEEDYKNLLIGKTTPAKLFITYLKPFNMTNVDLEYSIKMLTEIIN